MTTKKFFNGGILMLLALLCATHFSFAQPTAPSGKKWSKVEKLSDEFDTWDGSKWTKSLWNYGEPVQMVSENSGVWNGYLWIRATYDASSTRWFKTSRIMSKSQIKFPMYTECSMKTAHISAFTTFWLNNGDSNDRDEIDICEHNTKPSWPNDDDRPYEMYSQYFVVKDGVTERDHMPRVDTRTLSSTNPAKGKKWNEAYQTLGCYWKDKNNVIFYINGEKVGSVKSTKNFTRSLNIIWDLWTSEFEWTGGIANKNDLSNNNINTMYVDWIHTYELVDDSSASSSASFKNVGSQYYMSSADPEKMACSRTSVGSTEKFKIVDLGNNLVALKGANGKYVSSENGSITMRCNRAEVGAWEKFTMVDFGNNIYGLKGNNGLYVRNSMSCTSAGAGDWQKFKVTTGLKAGSVTMAETNSEASSFSVFPNPASSEISITGLSGNYDLSVFDVQGRIVRNSNITIKNKEFVYGVSSLNKGVYILRLQNEKGTQTSRFLKQ